jgi:hypothetical protein
MNSKGKLNDFKPDFWVFSKIGIWIMIQGFRSNKVELQIWNIFEIEFQTDLKTQIKEYGISMKGI